MRFLLTFLLLVAVEAQYDGSRFLWYETTGTDFNSALPIGNGRLGALVYGSATEKVTLNENSIWDGGFQNRANSKSKAALAGIRKLLQDGEITQAGQSTLSNMAGTPTSPRAYNPLADLNVDFGHASGSIKSYTRWLDTYQGNTGVSYIYNNANYTREYVASYPSGILAMRYKSSVAGSLNAKISLSRTNGVVSNTASSSGGSNAITLVVNSGVPFVAKVRVVTTGGTVAASGNSISVTGATTVDVIFDAETSYRYSGISGYTAEVDRKIASATTAGFDAIRAAAIADNTKLMSRVTLDLGRSSGNSGSQPTNNRIANYKNAPNNDIQIATLMFNYGRHLLVASSRDTGNLSLPANLQGLWNQDYSPSWGSKYTININTEMNYWHSETTNLGETTKPLFDLISVAQKRGQVMAQTMYGCGGFVLHHNTDLWGDAAPVDYGTPYTMWPMGAVWLAFHLMEHYRFTGDVAFLENTAWPVLLDAAKFFYCYLFMYNGYYVTGPSISPENPFKVPNNYKTAGASEGIDIGPTMDNSLLHELFSSIIEAGNVLKVASGADVAQARSYLAKIRSPQIGSRGQILEWRGEYAEVEPGHRHLSPLWGLFPGSQMGPLRNRTLANAAKVLLDHRLAGGSGSTGWSRTWVINCYARLFEGNTAWTSVVNFLQVYPLTNLWNSNSGPPFQIDGNFGFTSGITELLLQSHDVVHLLPALPTAVPTGSVSGLVARGGFIVDISWSGGRLKSAQIKSKLGNSLSLRVGNGVGFKVDGASYSGSLPTTAGASYTITL
ncbi:hypothetical protein VTL71DRAFT_1224 [Oculimacula yallundae]|uniref:Alpha-L-fucosidase n=1 Tax=Oculimacula yallundae TaxID=86028 RepID=A0ABR4CA51_9HELO